VASLEGVNLVVASLEGVNLVVASLEGVNLVVATLEGVNLVVPVLYFTISLHLKSGLTRRREWPFKRGITVLINYLFSVIYTILYRIRWI
jgi:hypothetical protein